MPIEFNCPYCTATIRVPDDAAGKTGSCPKCDSRLKVPVVDPPAGGPAPASPLPPHGTTLPQIAPPPSDHQSAAPNSLQSEAGRAEDRPPEATVPLVTDAPPSEAVTRYYRQRRKRHSSVWSRLVWPVLAGSLLIIAIVLYNRADQPSFEGTLHATPLDAELLLEAQLEPDRLNVPQPAWTELLEAVRAEPAELRTNLLTVRLDVEENALTLSLRAGPEADLVLVPVLESQPVARKVAELLPTLQQNRVQEMQLALDEFISDWRNHTGSPAELLGQFRDPLLLNVHRGGFGRICEAVAGGVRYPCVHEDEQGRLVFVVPRGTKDFEVRERSDTAGAPLFESPLVLHVVVDQPSTPR